MGTEVTPRVLAAKLIVDFVEGATIETDQLAYDDIVLTHARNVAALIVHHARAARDDPRYRAYLGRRSMDSDQTPMKAIATMALRYNAVRRERATT